MLIFFNVLNYFIKKYDIEVASNDITSIPNSVNVCKMVQRSKFWGTPSKSMVIL
jgi:hypothetical protein